MSLPVVAIVGRPNVGKSSLLNSLTGKMISIVEPTPGVTRDRVSAPCAVTEQHYVELVDTGGMGVEATDGLTRQVEDQIAFAVRAAELVLFVLDAREGVLPLDRLAAQSLRRANKPVLLLANKVDAVTQVVDTSEMRRLGFGDPLLISAAHGLGRAEIMEAVAARLGEKAADLPPPVMKLAVVGKRNAGKSTFINALCGADRVIVSEVPGTTRDSVDVSVELEGRRFVVIDTAGVRKMKKVASDIEFYSHHRAMLSIRRADVVALMIDASLPVSQVDKDLAGEIAKEFKPVVLVVSKWDLARQKASGEDYAEYLAKTFPELAFAPISLTAAKEGLNVRQTVRLAEDLFRQASTRVATSPLNAAIEEISQIRTPSHKPGTKVPKILYASQIGTNPPTVVCFVNDVRSFDGGYQRFLLNQLRERLPFAEVPIRLLLRQRRGASRAAWEAGEGKQRKAAMERQADIRTRVPVRRRPPGPPGEDRKTGRPEGGKSGKPKYPRQGGGKPEGRNAGNQGGGRNTGKPGGRGPKGRPPKRR